jgi:hypothetical protein
MEAAYYGETGKAVEEYYFLHRRLIFVLRRRFDYDQPLFARVLKTPPGTVKRVTDYRYYFERGRLYHSIVPATSTRSHTGEREGLEFLAQARKLLKMAQTRDSG